jgi:hypothetical protein
LVVCHFTCHPWQQRSLLSIFHFATSRQKLSAICFPAKQMFLCVRGWDPLGALENVSLQQLASLNRDALLIVKCGSALAQIPLRCAAHKSSRWLKREKRRLAADETKTETRTRSFPLVRRVLPLGARAKNQTHPRRRVTNKRQLSA